ncbi:uncharacterized protein LOC136081463 [Hydra vulgaris]|uniref:Uncharacterized protein LOC136081463 n=1 Tax=Hydra vulgaris TaxID=6087 RepID=A0ABM4C061_HYDVU
MILQNEGININVEGITHNLKGSIVTFSGDNLSAHTIGGFSACFSSGRICRNCMVPHINICNIKTESQCILRNKTSHDYHVNSVLIDPTLMPVVVIKGLVKDKFLTVCELRNILKNFKYGITERCNKPLPSNVPLNLVSNNKHISGKAVERKICQIILSPVIDIEWIPVITHLIARHHELLARLNPKSFTPKIHFLVHYPRMISQFGPLRLLWCLRFEAKHQYFKQIAHRVKNFRNITKTLAERHQMAKCALLSPANEWIQSSPVILECVPLFAEIKFILYLHGLWVICCILHYSLTYNPHLDAYITEKSDEWIVYTPGATINYQPLSSYNVNAQRKFNLINPLVIVLNSDSTEIDDDEALLHCVNEILIVLGTEQLWTHEIPVTSRSEQQGSSNSIG